MVRPHFIYMGLRSLLAIGILIVMTVANSGGAKHVTTCNAPELPGVQHNVTCNVSYTNVAEFVCPDVAGVNAYWRRKTNNGSDPLCKAQGHKCSLSNLTNEDTGLYFCFDPVSGGSNDYFVQLTVLAPPSLEDVAYCNETHFCVTTRVVVEITEDFTISVKYHGLEPFHVDWRHNNDTFTCEKPHCVEEHSPGETSITIHADPHTSEDPGWYYANVSNSYGWNVSATKALLDCYPPYPPITHSLNSSKTFTANDKASFSCEISISEDATLSICYASVGETYEDINKTESCTNCLAQNEGPCTPIRGKPHWKISRYRADGYCQFLMDTFVHIDHISEEDEGTLYCVYGDDNDVYHKVYTATRVTVKQSLVLILSVSVPAAVVLVLVVIVLVVVCPVVIRKNWTAKGKQIDIERLDNKDEEVNYRSQPRLTDYDGDSDSETETVTANAVRRKPKKRRIQHHVSTQHAPLLGAPYQVYGSSLTTDTDIHTRTGHRTMEGFAQDSEFPEEVPTDLLSSLGGSVPV